MTYRDELEAATQRAVQSEQELEAEREKLLQKEREIARLQSDLIKANSALVKVGQQPIVPVGGSAAPLSVANKRVLWIVGTSAAFGIFATLGASAGSETNGIFFAKIAAFFVGGAIGAWFGRYRSLPEMLARTLLWAMGIALLVALFFASVWSAL